ncbi:hypothetical protein SLITO_v1c07190 [Spiroplasma litorale]|uniref:Uncharacterized protein n=1 Tax=Spiroplasma litorale TaxID=216942 RepID=A0A0K1W205_9MOLU|nr:hypothetical protein [Spiroplasma litorale]AKX34344.1 hypothetical protein SLITO_v1c07190 [Spiroplasma litorale]
MIVIANYDESNKYLNPTNNTKYQLSFSLYGPNSDWNQGLFGSFGNVELLYKETNK